MATAYGATGSRCFRFRLPRENAFPEACRIVPSSARRTGRTVKKRGTAVDLERRLAPALDSGFRSSKIPIETIRRPKHFPV